jgi:hypothetical protein
MLTALSLFSALIAAPAHLHGSPQAPGTEDQHQHATVGSQQTGAVPDMHGMMASMMAADAKLDELVKKMNAATGSAKTDAMAELLMALVQQHRAMHGSMMNMTSMMDMMHGSMPMMQHDATPSGH